jgi:hypothetical protein
VMPQLHQLQQYPHPLPGIGCSGIVLVLVLVLIHILGGGSGDCLLLAGVLNKLQSSHDP